MKKIYVIICVLCISFCLSGCVDSIMDYLETSDYEIKEKTENRLNEQESNEYSDVDIAFLTWQKIFAEKTILS